MELNIHNVELLLLTAAVVAMIARRFHFPYTVGLIVAGIGLAVSPIKINIELTKELIYTGLLPPLIFEAANALKWSELKKVISPSLVFAILGTLIATIATAAGIHIALGWPLGAAATFGALIAATDPVSVIATFKEAGITGRLRTLVEAESLFNDGIATILFSLVVAFNEGMLLEPTHLVLNSIYTIAGGMFVGVLIGAGTLFLFGRTTDYLVELTLTTIAAYGSFFLAERLECSGVLATLMAGLVIGNKRNMGFITEKGDAAVKAFWEFAAFIANSLIFILIGIN